MNMGGSMCFENVGGSFKERFGLSLDKVCCVIISVGSIVVYCR